jgi:uncharacterized protein with von Willebrand factor type A (vWA) domain
MGEFDLTERVILFSRFLRDRGFKVFSSSISDALLSLEHTDLTMRGDFQAVLRANLVTSETEWKLFAHLFETFWGREEREEEKRRERSREDPEWDEEMSIREESGDVLPDRKARTEPAPQKETLEGKTYSPVQIIQRKDLARFERGDIQIAQLILKNMISPFRIAATRRFKRSKNPGDIDFRRILREGLKGEGMPFALFYRNKKKRFKRVVILADVSGSMDRYARFVMPFIMGLRGIGSKAEVFVFSTSLTPITPILKRHPIDKALEMISQEVPDWSGGTRIGYSLHQFNEQHGTRLLNRRTVLVIMSDGWDLGARDLLKREMETLSERAHCIIWLNPLAGDPEYKPLCRGMQTALPYLDYFLPADSLESLKRVGKTLSKVMVQ